MADVKETLNTTDWMKKKRWEKTFRDRLDPKYDELKWLYAELYNNDMQAFQYFCEMLYKSFKDRSAELKKWDLGREAMPEWFSGNEMLGMLMYTNAFAGTLKGVQSHVD